MLRATYKLFGESSDPKNILESFNCTNDPSVALIVTLTLFRYAAADTGNENEEKIKSEMAKEMTKAVVVCCRIFRSRSNTMAVTKLPN